MENDEAIEMEKKKQILTHFDSKFLRKENMQISQSPSCSELKNKIPFKLCA